MSNETKSIHEFDVKLICEFFTGLERQGPGSPEATLKALSFIDNLTSESRIADLGCGTGGQTMTLAQHAPGNITGMDLFPGFIEIFNRQAEQLGLQQRVKGIIGSMDDLPFQKEELDLIWSEGAIYNIGFVEGLQLWHPFLKNGGCVALTEACWFTDKRPAEIDAFWKSEYPGIDTVAAKVAQMQAAGYIPLATFLLPSECWKENYYKPQRACREAFLKKHSGNRTAVEFIANMQHEETMYEKFGKYYGYVFFIGKKSD